MMCMWVVILELCSSITVIQDITNCSCLPNTHIQDIQMCWNLNKSLSLVLLFATYIKYKQWLHRQLGNKN